MQPGLRGKKFRRVGGSGVVARLAIPEREMSIVQLQLLQEELLPAGLLSAASLQELRVRAAAAHATSKARMYV